MSSFAKLKKSSSLTNLSKSLEKKSFEKDNRYWELTPDKLGNAQAVIRFLDTPKVDLDSDEEAVPAVQIYTHGFKKDSKWYIENSLSTNGGEDPINQKYFEIYNEVMKSSGDKDKARDAAKDFQRKLSYISNILVLKDPQNPENEGKNFLFKYGAKVFKKIQTKLPEASGGPEEIDSDEVRYNPFDFWAGANFKLVRRGKGLLTSYDDSEFSSPSPLFKGDDAKIEALWKSLYSLKAEVAPDKFKSYDDLKKRMDYVLGNSSEGVVKTSRKATDVQPEADDVPTEAEMKKELKSAISDDHSDDDDDSDPFAEFSRLAGNG